MQSFVAYQNPMGFTSVRVHYTADPSKSPETEQGQRWLDQAKRLFPDENKWQQEMELSFWSATGRRVYPEFRELVHVQPLTHRPRKVLHRAWDFGWHSPACLIAQVDANDRLIVLREIVGREETTRQFAHTVRDRCAEWYPHHSAGFDDLCDPAGQQRQATAEASEVRDVEILNAIGIYPSWSYGWSRKDARSLVHQLLVVRSDQTPSLYIDGAHCPMLLQGFLGKYVYMARKDGQVKDEPDESNHPWADVHACLRYLVTGLYTALGLRRPLRASTSADSSVLTWHGYGSPIH